VDRLAGAQPAMVAASVACRQARAEEGMAAVGTAAEAPVEEEEVTVALAVEKPVAAVEEAEAEVEPHEEGKAAASVLGYEGVGCLEEVVAEEAGKAGAAKAGAESAMVAMVVDELAGGLEEAMEEEEHVEEEEAVVEHERAESAAGPVGERKG